MLEEYLFRIRDAVFNSGLCSGVLSVQQLLAGVDRLAAVVLCVTPSGMALFDLPAGSHCTAAVLSLPPLNSISEKLGLDHCLCSANESPLFTLHDSIRK